MKKDMTAALRTSLLAEEKATDSRFDRADALFGKMDEKTRVNPAPEPNRVVRDSFTIPSDEYERIARLRERGLRGGVIANKSELLRAGLAALNEMKDEDLLRLLRALPRVKTGRPTQTL